jgi:hypothetical protein
VLDVIILLQLVKIALAVLELTACQETNAKINVFQKVQDINATGMRPIQNVFKMMMET